MKRNNTKKVNGKHIELGKKMKLRKGVRTGVKSGYIGWQPL